MRPPIQRQSALRAPLNDVFGTEGSVRLLRVLTAECMPMTAGVIAHRARLERSAARRGLNALLDTGLVGVQGLGKIPQYVLRQEHPLAPAVAAVFLGERHRAEAVLDGVTAAVRKLSPPPVAVWLEGAVVDETDEPGEPIVIRVIAPARGLGAMLERLHQTLYLLEQTLDVTIEVAGATPADLRSRREEGDEWDMRLRRARSVAGLPPTAFLSSSRASHKNAGPASPESAERIRSHADLDKRALAIAETVARRLTKDPALIARAQEFVERRMLQSSPHERHELHEWMHILNGSPARIKRFLVDRGERATRLRQTLPFLGVLTSDERKALLESIPARARSGRDT